jgi:4-amino-4-deoxy-L-arabinose transferase-like glycosyltransferase
MSSVTADPVLPRHDAAQPRRWRGEAAALALLLSLSGFLFFYGLNAGELYRTESLRAIIAQEFLRGGSWVVPMLYGEPLLTKPPGMYAAIALASWPVGRVTEGTARLPSALAAAAVVLLFYGLFRRQLGVQAGLVAALVLPLQLMWLDKTPAAEIDMVQVAWVAGAIFCLLRALEAHEPDSSGRAWPWWLAAELCVAGGFLTKWTAPAFFYLTAVPLLWCRGQLRLLWSRQHLVSAALAGAICLTWVAAAIANVGWDVFYATVSREALMRLSPGHHHRPYPWLETLRHPFVIFVATLPCSAFAVFALRPGFARRWRERERRLLQAMHCWVWPNMLLWTFAPEHSVRHSAPLFTGIAGLAAFVWIDWFRRAAAQEGPARLRPRQVLLGLLLAWLLLKVTYVQAIVPARNRHREPRAKGEQIAAAVPENELLYLFRLKDEGIMFYYGRPVHRLAGPEQLPSSAKPLYCILDESEWCRWNQARPAAALLHLHDEQGAPIVLVRVAGSRGGELGP